MSNTRVFWLHADDPPDRFPPSNAALAEPDGLLAAGGDLRPERLLAAYRQGIFPWSEAGQPLLWWTPNPRCVFLPGDFRVSRRLRQEIRSTTAEIRINTAFDEVIRQCAAPRRSGQGTWITPDMDAAYRVLHALGWAHSIEVWLDNTLVGGLYGLAIGPVFFGESMYSRRPNSSKLALLYLAKRMQQGDLALLDCQVVSAHLQSLGARTLPRTEFRHRLDRLCEPVAPFDHWPDTAIACKALMST